MRDYVDNFFETLTTHRQERVSDLLEEARVAKEQFTSLVDNLQTRFTELVPLVLAHERVNVEIDSGVFGGNMRQAFLYVSELFQMSNLISVLLDSHTAVLTGDVKQIEDELIALDKLSKNYAFLLGDSRAYNFAYLEPFSDESGRDTQVNFFIPDRSGQVFGPAENAIIRSDEGVLALNSHIKTHALTGTILKGNGTAFVVNSTDLSEALIANSSTGWQMTVAAPSPITSSLPEAHGEKGAQVLIEFLLSQPAPAAEIKLVPFADHSMELLQVTVYPSNNDSSAVDVLQEKMIMDRPITLHFPLQTVSRFRILLNQPIYNRRIVPPNQYEEYYRKVIRTWKKVRKTPAPQDGGSTRHRHPHRRKFDLSYFLGWIRGLPIQQIVRRFADEVVERVDDFVGDFQDEIRETHDKIRSSIPSGWQSSAWGPMRTDDILRDVRSRLTDLDPWVDERNHGMNHVVHMVHHIRDEIEDLIRRIFGRKRRPTTPPKPTKPPKEEWEWREEVTVIEPPPPTLPPVSNNEYEYVLGLYFAGIGVDAPGFKGVFVSRSMDIEGDAGEIRLKTAENNYILPVTDRDSAQLTSVEYSVSNKSEPSLESDWIPVLSIGQKDVKGERCFPDSGGKVLFRFPANVNGDLSLYKNGYKIPLLPEAMLRSANRLTFIGAVLPLGSFTSQDIITVDYVPSELKTTVNFTAEGFTEVPLVSSFDANGAGEGFLASTGTNEIDLLHRPYIDSNQVAMSSYSVNGGMSPYQPVAVRFEDGSVAINLTNYGSGVQAALPVSSNYYFIHSGNIVKFNQPVLKPFRVYYQYLQSDVRVRVVLRVNSRDFVSPKVDYFHLKAKTRRADASSVF
ncbi:MAG TPA: hypothetical protein VJ742_12150 [Nitrososphaera sp.]|nr:hypothetical protein [Nitrososphaera sp.]